MPPCNSYKPKKDCLWTDKWDVYEFADINGKGYFNFDGEFIEIFICGMYKDVPCSIKLKRFCIQTEYNTALKNLQENGIQYLGQADFPDTSGYPDISNFMSSVVSYEQINEFWKIMGF